MRCGGRNRVEAFPAGHAGGEAAADAVATARQVRDQDVDLAGPAPVLRAGVAKDRRISVEDGQMRHGRKSRSVLFDGYKRHVLRDLDTGLITAPPSSTTSTSSPANLTTATISWLPDDYLTGALGPRPSPGPGPMGHPPPEATVNWKVVDQAPGLPAESMARTRQNRLPTGSVLVLT